MPPLASPSSGYLAGRSHHSYFVYLWVLAYISVILLVDQKKACAKMSEIKYIKNTTLCGTLIAFDPAKDRKKRTRIEPGMLDFRPGENRAMPAHPRIDGIDRDFLFGNVLQPSLHRGCSTLPLAFGGLIGKQGPGP